MAVVFWVARVARSGWHVLLFASLFFPLSLCSCPVGRGVSWGSVSHLSSEVESVPLTRSHHHRLSASPRALSFLRLALASTHTHPDYDSHKGLRLHLTISWRAFSYIFFVLSLFVGWVPRLCCFLYDTDTTSCFSSSFLLYLPQTTFSQFSCFTFLLSRYPWSWRIGHATRRIGNLSMPPGSAEDVIFSRQGFLQVGAHFLFTAFVTAGSFGGYA